MTRDQKEWLLDPRTINHFKENEWTLDERCEAFRNRFPDAPRLATGTMRQFYEYNNINKSLLYKDNNLRVNRTLIPATDGTVKSEADAILIHEPSDLLRLKHLRRERKFSEFTDE